MVNDRLPPLSNPSADFRFGERRSKPLRVTFSQRFGSARFIRGRPQSPQIWV